MFRICTKFVAIFFFPSASFSFQAYTVRGCRQQIVQLAHGFFNGLRNVQRVNKILAEKESSKYTQKQRDDASRFLPIEAMEMIEQTKSGFHFFTGSTGCYEPGFSNKYRGKMFMTYRANQCLNWKHFINFLHSHINTTQHNLRKSRWRIFTLERNYEDMQMDAQNEANLALANKTLSELHYHGIGDHNYCRDPDNVGKPWCFVDEKEFVWEFCAVPECCWQMHCWCSNPSGQMVPKTLKQADISSEMNCDVYNFSSKTS